MGLGTGAPRVTDVGVGLQARGEVMVRRYDYLTFRFAMAHLATHRPRVLVLAFDETDDWASRAGVAFDRIGPALLR